MTEQLPLDMQGPVDLGPVDLGPTRARLAGSPFAPPDLGQPTSVKPTAALDLLAGLAPRLVLEVSGEPVGKGRPRFSRRTGHAYTPAGTVDAERNWRAAWHAADEPRLEPGPLALALELVLTRPQSHRLRDGSLGTEGLRHPWPLRRPDVDNALKLAMDALEGAAYPADAHVVTATVARRWARPDEVSHSRLVLASLREDS